MKKIKVPYFPAGLKYSTPLLFGSGIYLAFTGSLIWATVLILVGAVILTTKYVTEIDLQHKRYRDYLSLLTLPVNQDAKTFTGVHRIIITKGSYSQTINTRAQSRQLDWSDYTGTLIFDDEATLDLLTRNDKRELIMALREFAEYLDVGIEDRTTNRRYWIDLAKTV